MKKVWFYLLLLLFTSGFLTTSQAQRNSWSGSFPVTEGGTLELTTREGDIAVIPWEQNEVSVTARGVSESDMDTVQDGNTLQITFNGRWSRAYFEVRVPSQFNLDLRTAGGDIEIQGELIGTIKGTTSGGDISLGDVEGTVDVQTSGGGVYTGTIQGDASLETSGGDIRVNAARGNLEVATSGGDINIGDVAAKLVATTAGGDIRIADVGGDADVTTAGGDIVLGNVAGSAVLKTAGGHIVLQSANGVARAETAGGDIKFGRVSGSIVATTAGGDVEAELIPGELGSSSLYTASGELQLVLPDDAQATIQARIRIRRSRRSNRETYNIHSDFPSESYEEDENLREIRGTYRLNGGGQEISLETVNGEIHIRKRGALR